MPGKGHRHDFTSHTAPVVVTENVEDYRACIPYYLNGEDVVLELGCAQGVTTTLIGNVVKEVIGIDKSEFQTVGAQVRNPNIQYLNIDAFDASAIIKLGKKFTAIFIDVSGNRGIGDVVALMETYTRIFKPRLIVIKCYKLKRLMGVCKVFPEDCLEGCTPFSGNQHNILPEHLGKPPLRAAEGSSLSVSGGADGAAVAAAAAAVCMGDSMQDPGQQSESHRHSHHVQRHHQGAGARRRCVLQ